MSDPEVLAAVVDIGKTVSFVLASMIVAGGLFVALAVTIEEIDEAVRRRRRERKGPR